MLAGAELGIDAPGIAAQTHFLGDIFLRLIRMIVAPLIFGGIVTGIAGHNQLSGVGRVASRPSSSLKSSPPSACSSAPSQSTLRRPAPVSRSSSRSGCRATARPEGWQQILLNIFPENIAKAVAENQILQVAVFALLFGAALALLPEPKRSPLLSVLQSLTETMFRLTRIIMVMAPVAAGAALAYTVGSMGVATLLPLGKLLVTCYATLLIFTAVLAVILLIARIPVGKFAVAIAEPAALGFATTSSEAALPLAMERMEEFGVPRWSSPSVIPTGYSFNMTGSSIYLSMAALFAAQAAGLHLSVMQQIVLLATLMLTSRASPAFRAPRW